MTLHPLRFTTEVRPRPEGGGDFAPALGGGSGANRFASEPGQVFTFAVRLSDGTGAARGLAARLVGGGSGANRFAGEPGRAVATPVPDLLRDLFPLKQRPRRGGRGAMGAGRGFAGRRANPVPDLIRDLAPPTDRRLAQGEVVL